MVADNSKPANAANDNPVEDVTTATTTTESNDKEAAVESNNTKNNHQNKREKQNNQHNNNDNKNNNNNNNHNRGRNHRNNKNNKQSHNKSKNNVNNHKNTTEQVKNSFNNDNDKKQDSNIVDIITLNDPKDERLPVNVQNDPRGEDPTKRMTKKSAGRNTESFDPASTLVRPDVRVCVGSPMIKRYNKPLKHDDVVIVPDLFGPEDDWSMYYQLIQEMTELQQQQVKGSEWISWHEGAHLIAKNPKGSKTFNDIIDRLCDYFNIRKESIGTRLNWYTSSNDWKPFHHDSAAFNAQRAKNQNITVGVSFGSTRELAFLRALPEQGNHHHHHHQQQNKEQQHQSLPCRLYFPQPNNGVFSFGRDVNIHWKHGINALPPHEHDGKGRISIVLWGLAQDVIEEEGSPALLGADGQGPHAASNNGHYHRKRYNNNNNNRGRHNNKSNNNNNGNHNNTTTKKDSTGPIQSHEKAKE